MTPARYDAVADFYVSGFDSVDISGNLIGKARKTEQDERLGIRYLHADIAAPGVLGPGGFDAAVCKVGADHRMLSTYLGTLRRHGLWLDQRTSAVPAVT